MEPGQPFTCGMELVMSPQWGHRETKWDPEDREILSVKQLMYLPGDLLVLLSQFQDLNIEFLFGATKRRACDLMMSMTKGIIHEHLIHSFINKYLLSISSLPGTVLA